MSYAYFDVVAHIQHYIDDICGDLNIPSYNVTSERKLDAYKDREIVVSSMAGQVGETTATIPYQLSLFANDPDEGILILTELAKRRANIAFESESEDENGNTVSYSIIGKYMTPTVMEADVEMLANYTCRIVQFVNFDVLINSLHISSVKYNSMPILFAQATSNFVSQMATNNKSGVSLMKNVATGAAVSITLTVPLQRTAFCVEVIKAMHGARDKNSAFSLEIGYGNQNDLIYSGNFVIQSATVNTVKGNITSLQVSFVEYDY